MQLIDPTLNINPQALAVMAMLQAMPADTAALDQLVGYEKTDMWVTRWTQAYYNGRERGVALTLGVLRLDEVRERPGLAVAWYEDRTGDQIVVKAQAIRGSEVVSPVTFATFDDDATTKTFRFGHVGEAAEWISGLVDRYLQGAAQDLEKHALIKAT